MPGICTLRPYTAVPVRDGDRSRGEWIYCPTCIQQQHRRTQAHGWVGEPIRELIEGWIDNIGGTISNPMTEFGFEGDLAYRVAKYAFEGTKAPDQGMGEVRRNNLLAKLLRRNKYVSQVRYHRHRQWA
jgi:hypothetical protein